MQAGNLRLDGAAMDSQPARESNWVRFIEWPDGLRRAGGLIHSIEATVVGADFRQPLRRRTPWPSGDCVRKRSYSVAF
jgi:hypothetical protein